MPRVAGMGRFGKAFGGITGAVGGAAGCAIKTAGPLGAPLLFYCPRQAAVSEVQGAAWRLLARAEIKQL